MDQERDRILRSYEEPRTVRMIRDLSVYCLKQSSLRRQVSGQLEDHIMDLNEAIVVDHERQQIKHHMLCSWWFRDLTATLPTRNYQVGNVFLAFRNGWHLLTRLSFSKLNMCFCSLFLKHISTQERFRICHPGILIPGSERKLKANIKKTLHLPLSLTKWSTKLPFSEEKFTFSLGEVSVLGRELPDNLSPVRFQLLKKTSILHGISPLYLRVTLVCPPNL